MQNPKVWGSISHRDFFFWPIVVTWRVTYFFISWCTVHELLLPLTLQTSLFWGFIEEYCFRAYKARVLVEIIGISISTQQYWNEKHPSVTLEVCYNVTVAGCSLLNMNSKIIVCQWTLARAAVLCFGIVKSRYTYNGLKQTNKTVHLFTKP